MIMVRFFSFPVLVYLYNGTFQKQVTVLCEKIHKD